MQHLQHRNQHLYFLPLNYFTITKKNSLMLSSLGVRLKPFNSLLRVALFLMLQVLQAQARILRGFWG